MENKLDARLRAIADLVEEAVSGKADPWFADIGCDHGYLTAHLLEQCAQLRAVASDVSAPSLEKAKTLLSARKLTDRATLAVADGLAAIDKRVDAIVIAGMGTQTILKIVREGKERIGGTALIVQSNVDLPALRIGLAALGFAVHEEKYTEAAGRYYVTMLARSAEEERLDERRALLGCAVEGLADDMMRGY